MASHKPIKFLCLSRPVSRSLCIPGKDRGAWFSTLRFTAVCLSHLICSRVALSLLLVSLSEIPDYCCVNPSSRVHVRVVIAVVALLLVERVSTHACVRACGCVCAHVCPCTRSHPCAFCVSKDKWLGSVAGLVQSY